MEHSIRISEADWNRVRASLFTADGSENAGVLFCGAATLSSQRILVVRQFVPVPREQYVIHEAYQLEVAPAFYNQIISTALREQVSPVLIHSHPHHEDAWYSASDDRGESRLLGVFESLLPNLFPASLVVTPVSALGRRLENGRFRTLSGLTICGPHSKTIRFLRDRETNESDRALSEQFDRQIRAFGRTGQKVLEKLKVAIVGVGGIGSLVAEQLARAGVRDFVIVDADLVEISNVSRQFGATTHDVGKAKVNVTAQNAKDLGANNIRAIDDTAIRQPVLMELRDRDIIFSCVDNDRTRAILNRFAHQYVVPVIDHGTRLDGRSGEISAAAGRVTLVGPGMVCLRCSHHLNAERIRAESMLAEERAALEREGYIVGINEPAPAIVSLNTVIAGLGVTAAFNMFLNITGGRQPINQIYDATAGRVFPVEARHEPTCDICGETLGVKGLGDSKLVSAYS